jgi:ascorbate-specific PTS system EIIC-type component UlaA
MKDERLTLTGWPAVPIFLMAVVTQVLTALVMAVPITWLVNHVFSANAIHAVFANDRLGYWRCVGMFAIWFAAQGRIKWTLKP